MGNDNESIEYLLKLSKNINKYMDEHDKLGFRLIRVHILIILRLVQVHPESIALNEFVDEHTNRVQITRAIRDLKKMDLITAESVKNGKPGQQPKFINLTEEGYTFYKYINT